MRPQHRSTLVPYTTLFRSDHAGDLPREILVADQVVDAPAQRFTRHEATHERQRGSDRKSTRLNSSHRCISYAVFCLKNTTDMLEAGEGERVRALRHGAVQM